jgi:hypothetical protein
MAGKSEFLQIRVTPKQKAALKRLARSAGFDVSAYVLMRALPQRRAPWDALVAALADDPAPSHRLAELHDLLAAASASEFDEVVGSGPPSGAALWLRAYVAAMVEHAAHEKGVAPPAWVMEVPALEVPWFATDLKALRPHLLRASPVAFRRRNLFVDATVGARR